MHASKSGTRGSDNYKVKGNLHWVSVAHGHAAEVRLYDRLFSTPAPGSRREGDPPEQESDFIDNLNPNSVNGVQAWLEPSPKQVGPEDRFQFERQGYFVADRFAAKEGEPVFNRTVTLTDSTAKNA